jgi:hypothetical protein
MVRAMVTLVLGAILGAVLTLASQLLIQTRVVPLVEARKRREDHWECAVRDLIELLMTSLSDGATDAHAAQGLFGDLGVLEAEPGQDREGIAKLRADHIWEVRKATRAFTAIAHTRVRLLTSLSSLRSSAGSTGSAWRWLAGGTRTTRKSRSMSAGPANTERGPP